MSVLSINNKTELLNIVSKYWDIEIAYRWPFGWERVRERFQAEIIRRIGLLRNVPHDLRSDISSIVMDVCDLHVNLATMTKKKYGYRYDVTDIHNQKMIIRLVYKTHGTS